MLVTVLVARMKFLPISNLGEKGLISSYRLGEHSPSWLGRNGSHTGHMTFGSRTLKEMNADAQLTFSFLCDL